MGGFPNHPHRGFETVTYMLHGRMRHHDSAGNSGLLQGGGAQWVTAGRGLVHSEMPEQEDGLMEGFQLWVNLPGKSKMIAPIYRDLVPEQIPEWTLSGGVTMRMIAGTVHSAQDGLLREYKGSVERPDTEPIFVDVHFANAAEIVLELPEAHNAFIYTYRGAVSVGEGLEARAISDMQMGILSTLPNARSVRISSAKAARCIVVAGRPLKEPIAQHGPFVMNTREELMKAFNDYQAGLIKS
jgi:quercetin 2,3-dioxygenase